MTEPHTEDPQAASSAPAINWWVDGPLLVLSALGSVVGAVLGFLLDVAGFWLIVGLHVVVAVAAFAIDPTLGTVVTGVMVAGWTLYAVASIVLLLGGEALQNKIAGVRERS